MTTISFDKNLKLNKNHFKDLEEFQLYLIKNLQNSELSDEHKYIIDKRLDDLNENPSSYISINELKSSIKRK
jgi:hypothetical protein